MVKAIIFDLDGTAIPNKKDGMPSLRLINTVTKAQQKVKVSAATGRPMSNSRNILKALKITNPCIIAGGTQIIDPVTEKTLWKKEMSAYQVREIISIAKSYPYEVWISDQLDASPTIEEIVIQPEQIIFIMTVTKKDAKNIMQKLAQIPDIITHEVISWAPDHIDIHITHKEATKKHALQELLNIENIDKEYLMVVGDANNDLPLFEVAAIKVAMKNGSDQLKEAADYVTDSVENDGLAKAIEKELSL